jgi:hypothetical protein
VPVCTIFLVFFLAACISHMMVLYFNIMRGKKFWISIMVASQYIYMPMSQ